MEKHIVPLHDSEGRKIWYDSTEQIKALTDHIDSVNFDMLFRASNQKHRISLSNRAFFQEAHYSALLEEAELKKGKEFPSKRKNSLKLISYADANCSRSLDVESVMKIYRQLSRNGLSGSITGMHKLDSVIEFIDFYNYYECRPLVKSCIIYCYFEKLHPFHDSSRRMGRLLALMCLLKNGYEFGKYCPVSEMIFHSLEELEESFEGSGGKNGITKPIECMLKAYSEGIDALAKMNETIKRTIS